MGMDFLYFPDNKLEYIPAVAFLLITLVIAMFTMMYIIKKSQKEARQAKELELQILSQTDSSAEPREKKSNTPAISVKPNQKTT